MTLKLPFDLNISDWGEVFKTVLTFLTFQSETIDLIIRGEDEEEGETIQ